MCMFPSCRSSLSKKIVYMDIFADMSAPGLNSTVGEPRSLSTSHPISTRGKNFERQSQSSSVRSRRVLLRFTRSNSRKPGRFTCQTESSSERRAKERMIVRAQDLRSKGRR
jgi:hypothetical protein